MTIEPEYWRELPEYSKNHFDAKINDSAYELLNLDKCYYLVSPSGIITMVDLNSNLNQKSSVTSSKSKYSRNASTSSPNDSTIASPNK